MGREGESAEMGGGGGAASGKVLVFVGVEVQVLEEPICYG